MHQVVQGFRERSGKGFEEVIGALISSLDNAIGRDHFAMLRMMNL